jgi:hypothetical protein
LPFDRRHCEEVASKLLSQFNHPTSFISPTTNTMLYLIGLGLADETDISVKGLEIVKKADRVYLEAYTSILLVDKQKLVSFLPTTSI